MLCWAPPSLRTFRAPLFGVYGLTETTGGVVQLAPEDHDPDGPREHLLRSAGKPQPPVQTFEDRLVSHGLLR